MFDRVTAVNVLTLSGLKGKYFKLHHNGGSITIRGYWQRKSGAEGGELVIDANEMEVIDFDGAGDLPRYVKEELKQNGIRVDF